MENIIFYLLIGLCLAELIVIAVNYKRINKHKIEISGSFAASNYLKKQNDELTNELEKLRVISNNGWELAEKHAGTIEHLRSEYNLLDETNNKQIVQIQSCEKIIKDQQSQIESLIEQNKVRIEALTGYEEIISEQKKTIKLLNDTNNDQKRTIKSLIKYQKEMSEEIGFKQEKIERLEKENAKPKHKNNPKK